MRHTIQVEVDAEGMNPEEVLKLFSNVLRTGISESHRQAKWLEDEMNWQNKTKTWKDITDIAINEPDLVRGEVLV